jgi:ABC-type Fe3+-hydroxamate transport system substrate-binding protein
MAEVQAPFIQEKLTQLGLRTLLVPGQTIEQALTGIVTVGKATGSEPKARKLAAQSRTAIDKVRTRAAKLPKPTVLCVVDRPADSLRDIYTATSGSFLVELIAIAGGNPVTLPSKIGYGKIGKETLLALNPDIILDLMPGSKGQSSADPRQAWRDLPELKAVQTGRVFQIFEDYVPHASQRIAETAVIFAKRIHPEVPAEEWGQP